MSLKKPREQTKLEKAIDDILIELSELSSQTDEYAAMVEQLVKLHKMKEDEKPSRVSQDTVATIAAHLAGILLIVGYERTNVVTTKALAFMHKLK
jgi:hypothetical protein